MVCRRGDEGEKKKISGIGEKRRESKYISKNRKVKSKINKESKEIR